MTQKQDEALEKNWFGHDGMQKALQEADGNLDDAIKKLENSALKAEKKASRTAVEGVIL